MKIEFFVDFGHVQLNFPHRECERGRLSKGLVPTTQPAMPPIPVVFPTSRTFFFAPSTRMSGHRTNDSQAGARSSLRNRAKSIFTRQSKGCTLAESSVSQPSSLKSQASVFTHERSHQNRQQQLLRSPILHSRQSQQKVSFLGSSDSLVPSSPNPKIFVPSASHPPHGFDETTLSSPTYLQTLLESPARNSKDASVISISKPIKCIKIHYGPSHPSPPKQQPLRSRTVGVRSSNNGSFQQYQQQTTNEFDYRKYLRSTRRNRITDQEQRITLIATVPDETMFMRGTATCRAPRPSTLYNATTNS